MNPVGTAFDSGPPPLAYFEGFPPPAETLPPPSILMGVVSAFAKSVFFFRPSRPIFAAAVCYQLPPPYLIDESVDPARGFFLFIFRRPSSPFFFSFQTFFCEIVFERVSLILRFNRIF
jgi:hypothetical protein